MLTPETVEKWLAADGWPFQRLNESTWGSAFRSAQFEFKFFVRLTQHWLYLTIVPVVTVPADAAAASTLYQRLLLLNREVALAKFALEANEVILTVELPTESLAQTQFKDGLDALSYYANTHYPELLKLAGSR